MSLQDIEAKVRMLFKPLNLKARAALELQDAERAKLDAETARDWAFSVIQYNEARITRLREYLKSDDGEPPSSSKG